MKHALPCLALAATLLPAHADWPNWGGGSSRNMVAEGTVSTDINPGKKIKGKDDVDMATTKGLKWVTRLGSQAYGTSVISQGKVYLGTNNENPFDTKFTGDRGVLLCLDEKTGQMIWQFASPKLGTGKVSDWEYLGICSGGAVEGNRLYLTTNRCQVVCLDTEGMKNGNDGPFKDEAKYFSTPENKIDAVGENDADIIWAFDMRDECGVFPHNITSSNVLIVDDRIYATTSNGVDWTHTNIPAPEAPSLICLDKNTGKLLGEEASGVSKRCLHCSWSSPALAVIGGKKQVIFGGGDGYAYGFDLSFKKDEDFNVMNEIWRYDGNSPEYRGTPEKKKKYSDYDGPSEIISTPVVYKDHIYTLIGQDPEHGEGVGMLSCLNPSATGDISGKALWTYKGINRSVSTPSIKDDIIYVADYSGLVHCLNALTGEKYWVYDTKGHIWGSTMIVGDKLLIGNEEGELHVLQTGKEMKELATIDFPGPLYATPIFSNDTLYIMTMSHLYAFGAK